MSGSNRRRIEIDELGGNPPTYAINFIDRKLLDEQNIQKVGEDLVRLVDEAPAGAKFILNLGNVEYLSSAALHISSPP